MKNEKIIKSNWLKSKEVQKALKVRACELMHMRVEGKLRFEKKGEGFSLFQRRR